MNLNKTKNNSISLSVKEYIPNNFNSIYFINFDVIVTFICECQAQLIELLVEVGNIASEPSVVIQNKKLFSNHWMLEILGSLLSLNLRVSYHFGLSTASFLTNLDLTTEFLKNKFLIKKKERRSLLPKKYRIILGNVGTFLDLLLKSLLEKQ